MEKEIEYLTETIDKAHKNAVSKGFWDGEQNKFEKLMLIVSELSEALEADRTSKRSNFKDYHNQEQKTSWLEAFEAHVKNSFEDEIVDVFIRLFDYCGAYGISMKTFTEHPINERLDRSTNVGEQLLYLVKALHHIFESAYDGFVATEAAGVRRLISILFWLCENKWKVDIKKHIWLKMKYNESRPKKHGKNYQQEREQGWY